MKFQKYSLLYFDALYLKEFFPDQKCFRKNNPKHLRDFNPKYQVYYQIRKNKTIQFNNLIYFDYFDINKF